MIEKYTNEYLDIKGKFQSLQGTNQQGSQILKNFGRDLIIRAVIMIQSNFYVKLMMKILMKRKRKL